MKSDSKIQDKPKIHPKIRRRRTEVILKRNKRRLRVLIVVGVLVFVFLVFSAVVFSPISQVRSVIVQGNTHETSQQVETVANIYNQKPQLFLLNLSQMQKEIETLPWVLTATVKRNWPDQIVITVKDRIPVAQINMGKSGWALVDIYGRVLQINPQFEAGYFEIDNLGSNLIPGQNLNSFAISALNVAKIVPVILGPIAIKEVIGSDNSVSIVLGSNNTIFLGSASDVRQKLLEALAIVNHGSLLPNQIIDVSIPNSPVVTSSSIVNSRNG
jgi:cell division protein FtsQ